MGGGLWGLCFGKEPLTVVPWLALVPLLTLLGRPHAWFLGFLHGLGFWLVSIPWIAPTLDNYGQLSPWLAIVGLIALSSFLALYQALFAWLGSPLWLRGGLVSLLGLPSLWVVTEWLRSHLFSGFPWNLAAYAWVDVPGALQTSAWIGAFGVSFLVVFCNVGIAKAWQMRSWKLVFVTVNIVLLILAAGGRWAGRGVEYGQGWPMSVRILQPNFDIAMDWDRDEVDRNMKKLFSMSREACDVPGALILWPESAGWPYSFFRDDEFRQQVEQLAGEGCPVLMNSSTSSESGDHNSVLLIDKDGVAGQYDKHLLVPFGEYVPMSQWVPFLNQIARNVGSFSPGSKTSPLQFGNENLAIAVCYEITYPGEVARQVRQGATTIVTVTNDAWYGDSTAPWQHFNAARFRAAESRRYVTRAALTGVSAVVAPDGSVDQEFGVGAEGILKADVSGAHGLTLYSAAPWIIPLLSFVTLGFAIFFARRTFRR